MLITSAVSFFVLRIYVGQFMLVFLVCFLCSCIAVFWIYVALLLMSNVWLRSVLCNPNIYHPHKSPELRDSAAQTADRELQSAGPPILLTSVDTPFGCRPRGLSGICILTQLLVWNLEDVRCFNFAAQCTNFLCMQEMCKLMNSCMVRP